MLAIKPLAENQTSASHRKKSGRKKVVKLINGTPQNSSTTGQRPFLQSGVWRKEVRCFYYKQMVLKLVHCSALMHCSVKKIQACVIVIYFYFQPEIVSHRIRYLIPGQENKLPYGQSWYVDSNMSGKLSLFVYHLLNPIQPIYY